jgi:hypothetical protein
MMGMASDLGSIKKMWLNKCGVASVVPSEDIRKDTANLLPFQEGNERGTFNHPYE